MNSSDNYSWLRSFLEPCNRTELYQICRRNGLEVPPHAQRDDMIDCIIGVKPVPATGHPIDAWRLAIMEVIIEHKDVVVASLSCPAKTLDPRACFQCVDQQVISCLVQNQKDEHLIASKRLVRPTRSESMSVSQQRISIADAPRSLEELLKRSPYRLSGLAEELSTKINPSTGRPFFASSKDPSPEARQVWSVFSSGSSQTVAPVVFAALQEHDKYFPPTGAPAPQVMPPQMAPQPQAMPMPAPVPMDMPPTGMAPAPMAMPQPAPMTAPPMPAPVAIPTGPYPGMPGAMPMPAPAPQAMPQPMAPPTAAPTAAPAAVEAPSGRTRTKAAPSAEEIKEVSAKLDTISQQLEQLIQFCTNADHRLGNLEALAAGEVKGRALLLSLGLMQATVVMEDAQENIARFASDQAGNVAQMFEGKAG